MLTDVLIITQEINIKIRKAIRKHNQLTKMCLQGYGFDRHLYALKYQAMKTGAPMVSYAPIGAC